MIQSMTGFGKSSLQLEDKKITIEIKSLNSKGMDISVRLPMIFREKELEIRKVLSDRLFRGKVDVLISLENSVSRTSQSINKELVKSYISQLKEIVNGDETELLKMAVRMPDVLSASLEDFDQVLYNQVLNLLEEAISQVENFRKAEGVSLEKDFSERLQRISDFVSQVVVLDTERLQNIRERLNKSVNEIRERVDENRFEQELIFYLEKLDINEEKVRLINHLEYFTETMKESFSGRKLGFIAQEMGREINTMGSKANFAPIQQIVVQMKDELEKIKEQTANVL